MGLLSLISFSGIQLVDSSVHLTCTSQPFVVITGLLYPLTIVLELSPGDSATESSFLNETTSLSNPVSHPSWSTCVIMFSAITLTPYSSMRPSGNSSSYTLVSKMGLGLASPMGSPFASRFLFLTFVNIG